jgi:HD-like signal output (HDOD) protein
MEILDPEFSNALLAAIDRIHAFPVTAQNILKLTGDVTCSPRDLVDVIDRDPIITIKLLRVVNSAHYSLPRKITSIDHAVVLLGFNTVKNLALGIAALGMGETLSHPSFNARSYVRHSLAAAVIARHLGVHIGAADPHDFFIAGLLHDFGKVVLAEVLPAQFQKALEYSVWHEVSLHQSLLELAGMDHAAVGAALLEKWRFPANLVLAVRDQYAVGSTGSDMAVCVYAANQICKQVGVDFAALVKPQAFPARVQAVLGGTLESTMESLGDVSEILREATQFSSL